jgi:SAM-dependent methyltransferase
MTELVFVLGKNWILSIAELVMHIQDRGFAGGITDHSRTAAIVRIHDDLDDASLMEMLGSLGGCFKVGKVIEKIDRQLVQGAFPRRGKIEKQNRNTLRKCEWVSKIWKRPANKRIRFGVSTYPLFGKESDIDLKKFTLGMDQWIKRRLLDKKAKHVAYYAYDEADKRDPKKPNTALWPGTIARYNLLSPPNAEILAAIMQTKLYLAKTIAVYDSELQRYRDESRPYVEAEISTSPKLCRTLLTLAGARSGDTVLDPFCGTGTLLMEAAMLGMRCIGVDINGDAVQGARSNLKWMGIDFGDRLDFRVIKGDARNIGSLVNETVDAIAFEPDLGPVHAQKPNKQASEQILKILTQLYRDVLIGLDSCLRSGGRVAMTIPVINSTEGEVTIDLQAMLNQTPFRVKKLLPKNGFLENGPSDYRLRIVTDRFTLPERKWGQTVQRQVLALER